MAFEHCCERNDRSASKYEIERERVCNSVQQTRFKNLIDFFCFDVTFGIVISAPIVSVTHKELLKIL